MRSALVGDLEKRIKTLKQKKTFCENLCVKHIPNFQAFLETFLEGLRDYYSKVCLDLDDQIREIEDVINDICGINDK